MIALPTSSEYKNESNDWKMVVGRLRLFEIALVKRKVEQVSQKKFISYIERILFVAMAAAVWNRNLRRLGLETGFRR